MYKLCTIKGLCNRSIIEIYPYKVGYFFWGELIDKYKDINANSKTVFTDYAMLKLVHIVPIYF